VSVRRTVRVCPSCGWHTRFPDLVPAGALDDAERALAIAAPPEGGPVVAIPVSTLEELTGELEALREAAGA